MADNTVSYAKRLTRLLGSNKFFYAITAVFVIESVWIALSGRYPMAFDEDFHLGIIRLYAQQWSPFFAAQPAGADVFGAVVRDPSYLQHYLLSFPYRLTHNLFHSTFFDILNLRFIGIAVMAVGLFVYRKLLLLTTASRPLVNTVLLLFILTPVVPFLAGQINYDRVLFTLCGLILLVAVQFASRLRAGRFDTPKLGVLLSLCMLASLVKYSFLPVFFGVIVYIGLEMKRAVAAKGITLKRLARDAKLELLRSANKVKLSLAVLAVCSVGLFTAMYGYNLVRYHTPIPECDQVLNAQQCTAYGAWYRNYQFAQSKTQVNDNPFKFSLNWGNTYLTSTFFAVNGIYSGFIIGPPFPILHIASIVMFLLGLALVMWQIRRLWQQPALRLFIIVIAIYTIALWLQNYSEFIHLGQHVAEHGRYFIMLLPVLYLLIGLAIRSVTFQNTKLKFGILAITLVIFSQGGGALTYIARSDSSWWWQDNKLAPALNTTAQRFVKPWLIGSNRQNIKPWEQNN